jgi:hypothetical protein
MNHYHPDWDHTEEEILRHFDWHITPLRPADVQFDDSGRGQQRSDTDR